MSPPDDVMELAASKWTSGARMVLAGGMVMSRDEVVDSLRHTPSWVSYTIDDPPISTVGDGTVALMYLGVGHRDDGDDFTAVMTSVYVRVGDSWELAHCQQTPKP